MKRSCNVPVPLREAFNQSFLKKPLNKSISSIIHLYTNPKSFEMRVTNRQRNVLIALTVAALLVAAPSLVLIITVSALAMLRISILRTKWVSTPLFRLFKKTMPSVSTTERAAIEAGGTWWETSLFYGKPDWKALDKLQLSGLSDEEKNFLETETETLCNMVNQCQIQRQKDLPESVWTFIKAKGFLGMIIPRAYGGLEFSAAAHAAVVAKLASCSPVLAVTVMVPNSLGPAELLMAYGNKKQKEHYLPKLARGDEIPCFALSSIKAGSDAGALEDFGIVCQGEYEGESQLGLRLTWRKRYITLAPIATLLGLAVKVYDPDGLLSKKISSGRKSLGITCVLVPTDTAGVHHGRRHNPLGTYFHNGPTWGQNVFVPLDFVIGGAKKIGRGWNMLVECLSVGRGISLPALSEAAAQGALYASSGYAQVREQFHCPIGRFEGVQEQLTQLAILSHTISAVNKLTLTALDMGKKPSVVSAMVKYFCTENARLAVNAAMDIHGGKAIIEGERNYLAAMYKSLPILITVEGANILTRSLMIFGQGALRCHPYLYKEFSQFSKKDSPNRVKKFDNLLLSHLGYHLKNLARATIYGILPWRWLASEPPLSIHSELRPFVYRVNYLSALFAYLSDLTVLVLGGTFKKREMISGRLADAWTALYACAALLKQASQGAGDVRLSELACRHHCVQAEEALFEARRALPKPFACWTRLQFFPWGKRISANTDRMRVDLANRLLNDHRLRLDLADKLCFKNYAELDHALSLAVKTRDLRDSLRRKIKDKKQNDQPIPQTEETWLAKLREEEIINPQECAQLEQWQSAVKRALAVDDYERL